MQLRITAGSLATVLCLLVMHARTAADTPQPIKPLVFQGEPIFVISTYDPPMTQRGDIIESDWSEWVQAGANTTLYHVAPADNPDAQSEAWKDMEAFMKKAEKHNIAAIYYICGWGVYSKGPKNELAMTIPSEIPEKSRWIADLQNRTRGHSQTLGYKTCDEIENCLYETHTSLVEKGEVKETLEEWLVRGWKWTYDTLKAGAPEKYVFANIAWEPSYDKLAPVYDVNLPNGYPNMAAGPEYAGDLYIVVQDAAIAANAIRASGRTSFIYMPWMADIEDNLPRASTFREVRYVFFAPITQGAMGVMGYRMARTTPRIREAVVYPVMRELKRFVPWFLGEWHDEKVTSDHDVSTVKYLQDLPLYGGKIKGRDQVPDCSHMLRRADDGSYLLLAVNNRRETVEVTFTLDIDNLPDSVIESIDYTTIEIKNREIKARFEPFDVHAYVIRPVK